MDCNRMSPLDGLRIRTLDGLDLIVMRDADGDIEIMQEGETIFLQAVSVPLVIRALRQLSEPRVVITQKGHAELWNIQGERLPASDLVRQAEPCDLDTPTPPSAA